MRYVPLIKTDDSVIRPDLSAYDIEQGGLSSTVRAYDTQDFLLPDKQADVPQGSPSTEHDPDIFHFQNDILRRCIHDPIPRGKNSNVKMIIKP